MPHRQPGRDSPRQTGGPRVTQASEVRTLLNGDEVPLTRLTEEQILEI